MTFDYAAAPYPIRRDLPEAHRRAWQRLARPGTWWSGAERVAIAAEARRASACELCRERRHALSPYASGEHEARDLLSAAAVDAVHRLVTDAARLTHTWVEKSAAAGLDDARYVELLGVVVTLLSIDAFHCGLGLPIEPLPAPEAGEPTRYRPAQARSDGAFVPMIPADGATGEEADLWQARRTANVIRALSLVPDAVRALRDLSAAQYLPLDLVASPGDNGGRALDRAQMELLAGRVSALNQCFY